jgi:hypothetical protein
MKKLYHLFWINFHEWRGAVATKALQNEFGLVRGEELLNIATHHLDRINYHLEKMI